MDLTVHIHDAPAAAACDSRDDVDNEAPLLVRQDAVDGHESEQRYHDVKLDVQVARLTKQAGYKRAQESRFSKRRGMA